MLAAGALALLTACGDKTGTPPFERAMPFPVGMALRSSATPSLQAEPGFPGANTAYVLGANFNLEYSGGSIRVLDLPKLEELIAKDNGKYRAKRFPDLVPSVFDDAILAGQGVEVLNFGGELRYARMGETELLFAAVREGNSITPIEIGDNGRSLRCFLNSPEGGQVCKRPASIETGADDPFGLTFLPAGAAGLTESHLLVSHLRRGEIASFAMDTFAADRNLDALLLRRRILQTRSGGASSIVVSPITGAAYAPLRYDDVEAAMLGFFFLRDLANAPLNPDLSPVSIPFTYLQFGRTLGANEIRSAILSPDGRTLYAISRSPDQLAAIDIAPSPDGRNIAHRVKRSAALCAGAGRVLYLDMEQARDVLLISCHDDDMVMVADPFTLEIIRGIQGDFFDGPFEMIPYKVPSSHSPDGVALRVLVGNFEDGTVTVLSVDRSAHQIEPVARVGARRAAGRDF
ncbi:MAG: hypothetical protein GMKNLPBB_01965 [Myxococcota bacterium]|nr:hypothetical protein [Myxococcota bacterium]